MKRKSREEMLQRVQQAKDVPLTLEVRDDAGQLLSIMAPMTNTLEQVQLIADWREMAREWYPTVFPYNLENTARWIDKQVVGNPERILFLLRTMEGVPWGHLGLATFTWDPISVEIDAVMRGRSDVLPGAMTHAVRALLRWTTEHLGIPSIGLRVFEDNERAIKLYERLGFRRERLIPLTFEQGDPISSWREVKEGEAPQRHFLVMKLEA